MTKAYYNEICPEKAAVIRELIRANVVAPGDVDERSISDVSADDVRGYTQCHWFAGFGVWSYALRLAGWADDRAVWTGSCPCQPFSMAGKREGVNDVRHLWPDWFNLIQQCRPRVIFGEQVAAAIGKCDEDQDLYELRKRIDARYVQEMWAGIQRWPQASLQELSERVRHEMASYEQILAQATAAEAEKRGRGISAGVDREEQGLLFGFGMPPQMQEERSSLRPRSTHPRDSGADRSGDMRTDGVCADTGSKQGQEIQQPLNRPENTTPGLSVFQHQDHLPSNESSPRGMGRGSTVECLAGMEQEEGQLNEGFTDGDVPDPDEEFRESWLDIICDNLEGEAYSVRPAVLGACSVGAPHIRQRLYFCADTGCKAGEGRSADRSERPDAAPGARQFSPARIGSIVGQLSDTESERLRETRSGSGRSTERAGDHGEPIGSSDALHTKRRPHMQHGDHGRDGTDAGRTEAHSESGTCGEVRHGGDSAQRGLAMHGSASGNAGHAALTDEAGSGDHSERDGRGTRRNDDSADERIIIDATSQPRIWRGPGWLDPDAARSATAAGATRGFWADCDWWYGRDGKYRPIGPGIFPLAHGVANRVLKLRGYGDAINAEVAKAFIAAYMEATEDVG